MEIDARFESTRKAGLLGILGNIFLLIIKGFIGFITHSQSMIADSINSASDIFASLMTFLGNKIASVPDDNNHNFGHGKAEYLFSLLISIATILIASKLLLSSVNSFFIGNNFEFSAWLIIVCFITIILKFTMFLYTKKQYNKYENILLEANYKDHRNDCIVTTGTLLSCIFAYYGIFWLDSLVGTLISLWIFFTGVKIFIESYNVLMDMSIDTKSQDEILDLAKSFPDIKEIANFYSTPVGYQYNIFITICVDGNMSTFESHKLADSLEKQIEQIDRIHRVIVHVNPL